VRPDRCSRAPTRSTSATPGTVARFLPPVATLAVGDVRFDGDPRVRERPLGPLLAALRALGAELDGVAGLPLVVSGRGALRGGTVQLDASASSQFVSGLLLSAPRFEQGVTVRHVGGRLPSAPHLAMTVEALRAAGATVDDSEPGRWSVSPGPAGPARRGRRAGPVDGGGLPGRPARRRRLGDRAGLAAGHSQPGAVLPDLLEAMGGRISRRRQHHRVGRRRAARHPTPTSARRPSSRRAHSASRRSRTARAASPRRAHPAARDRPAGALVDGAQRPGRRRPRAPGRGGGAPRPLTGE
jgi:hypothetical protein